MRPGAMCPQCGSLERQRLAWLYMATETDLLSRTAPKRLLHVSPDRSLEQRLGQETHIGQITADLDPARVMVGMNLEAIQFPDASFEIIYCSHVLEHVLDDRRAIAEMFRVLAPGGWAILQVPLWDQETVEDASVTGEAERTVRFGQRDHVRRYGRNDYPLRLADAGFRVTVDPFARRIGRASVERFGLTLQEEIHMGHKLGLGDDPPVVRLLTDLVQGPSAIVGRVEHISGGGVVTGWAWKPDTPDMRLSVRAILDGRDVGGDVADRHRESLAVAGVGDGRHCFRVALPGTGAGAHHLRVEAEGSPLPPASSFSTTIEDIGDPWYVIDVVTDPSHRTPES